MWRNPSHRRDCEQLLLLAQELFEGVVILHDDLQRRGGLRGRRRRPPRRGDEGSFRPLPALSGASRPSGRCGRRRGLKCARGRERGRGAGAHAGWENTPQQNMLLSRNGLGPEGHALGWQFHLSEAVRLQRHGSAQAEPTKVWSERGSCALCRNLPTAKSGTWFTPVSMYFEEKLLFPAWRFAPTSDDEEAPPVPPLPLPLPPSPPPPPSAAAEKSMLPGVARPSPSPPSVGQSSLLRPFEDRPTRGGCPARRLPLLDIEEDDEDADVPDALPEDDGGVGVGEEAEAPPP